MPAGRRVTEKNSRDANECGSLQYLKKTSAPEHRPSALEWRPGALEWQDKAKGTPNHCDGSMIQWVVALSRRVGLLPRLHEGSRWRAAGRCPDRNQGSTRRWHERRIHRYGIRRSFAANRSLFSSVLVGKFSVDSQRASRWTPAAALLG